MCGDFNARSGDLCDFVEDDFLMTLVVIVLQV